MPHESETLTRQSLVELEGGQSLVDLSGGDYDFHDDEIISIHLDRKLESSMFINCVNLKGVSIINLKIHEIYDVKLEGFSIQNVIYELRIYRLLKKKSKFSDLYNSSYLIEIDSSYGLGGSIECERIKIELR